MLSRLRHVILPRWQRYYALRAHLSPARRGFFVEAGANDGLAQSNTVLLERNSGWTGLLIEPVPALAALCRRNRPGCAVEECALVAPGYGREAIHMTDVGLMSVVSGAMKTEEATREHILLGAEVQSIIPAELDVPALTLTEALNRHRVPSVDFLSLDVEGYELQALQGIDFRQYQPTHILVEARFRQEIDDFLLPRYSVVAEMGDYDVLYRLRRVG